VEASTLTTSAALDVEKVYEIFGNATDNYPEWTDVIANATEYCFSTAFSISSNLFYLSLL